MKRALHAALPAVVFVVDPQDAARSRRKLPCLGCEEQHHAQSCPLLPYDNEGLLDTMKLVKERREKQNSLEASNDLSALAAELEKADFFHLVEGQRACTASMAIFSQKIYIWRIAMEQRQIIAKQLTSTSSQTDKGDQPLVDTIALEEDAEKEDQGPTLPKRFIHRSALLVLDERPAGSPLKKLDGHRYEVMANKLRDNFAFVLRTASGARLTYEDFASASHTHWQTVANYQILGTGSLKI